MSEEEIRIAVADLCGWVNLGKPYGWKHPNGACVGPPPNYTQSLDACREFEEPMFKAGTLFLYYLAIGDLLTKTATGFVTDRHIFMAPPITRCEAFISLHSKEVAS